ncbi:hypothetical protein OV203_02510 [Nannocystis sp. ILAH1]|uniref:hypothetical protein n=1 Tax=Nannocystis sp. ILAH1 TaxID=2996789 RepID=UPI00226F8015|nr:hypothetical protein [Nannocystis sp. ILAH1]MCY0985984.1 hypothetical protein [Nannocystis sp. ILAH1]
MSVRQDLETLTVSAVKSCLAEIAGGQGRPVGDDQTKAQAAAEALKAIFACEPLAELIRRVLMHGDEQLEGRHE